MSSCVDKIIVPFDQNLERVLQDLVADKDRELAETVQQLREKVSKNTVM